MVEGVAVDPDESTVPADVGFPISVDVELVLDETAIPEVVGLSIVLEGMVSMLDEIPTLVFDGFSILFKSMELRLGEISTPDVVEYSLVLAVVVPMLDDITIPGVV